MTAPTLHESALEYATDRAPELADARTLQRAYMAGALEALARLKAGEDSGELWRQIVAYGRTVGTGLEVAR